MDQIRRVAGSFEELPDKPCKPGAVPIRLGVAKKDEIVARSPTTKVGRSLGTRRARGWRARAARPSCAARGDARVTAVLARRRAFAAGPPARYPAAAPPLRVSEPGGAAPQAAPPGERRPRALTRSGGGFFSGAREARRLRLFCAAWLPGDAGGAGPRCEVRTSRKNFGVGMVVGAPPSSRRIASPKFPAPASFPTDNFRAWDLATEVSGTGVVDADHLRMSADAPWTWEDLAFNSMHPVAYYSIYRGEPNGTFDCVHASAAPQWSGDGNDPAPGGLFAYLVTATNAGGEETGAGHAEPGEIGVAAADDRPDVQAGPTLAPRSRRGASVGPA